MWEVKPTGPNARDGLGDMKSGKKQGFNNHLPRSCVWWAGSPRVVTMGFLPTQHTSPSSSPSLTEYYGVNNLPEEVTWTYYSLFGFSHTSILTAITSAGYHSRLVVLENGSL